MTTIREEPRFKEALNQSATTLYDFSFFYRR